MSNFSDIKLLAMDVDGVLTDGGLYIGKNGEIAKCFDVQDGMGISIANRKGLVIAFISGRSKEIVSERAKELKIKYCFAEEKDKCERLKKIMQELSLTENQVAYIGDDLNDLPAFSVAGLKIAVQNARQEVKDAADYVTKFFGGHGAVREVIEKILKAQNKWDEVVQEYKKAGQGDRQ